MSLPCRSFRASCGRLPRHMVDVAGCAGDGCGGPPGSLCGAYHRRWCGPGFRHGLCALAGIGFGRSDDCVVVSGFGQAQIRWAFCQRHAARTTVAASGVCPGANSSVSRAPLRLTERASGAGPRYPTSVVGRRRSHQHRSRSGDVLRTSSTWLGGRINRSSPVME
jgi:hypothetical protein